MLLTLIKKELLTNLMSSRFVLIFLLCFTLILISAYTMRSKYEERVEEYSAAVNMHRQELARLEGYGAIGQVVTSGYKLDKPPVPLSTIVEGMEGDAGRYASIGVYLDPRLDGGRDIDPMSTYFGTLDIAYIVRVVLSLVAILLTYDAVSGEREQGTLKLVMANSVPKYAILLSKCIAGCVTLLLPFLVPVLIALLLLITSGSIDFSGQDWVRLGFILLISLLYIGFFLMAGLLVSIQVNRSQTALMMLLFLWVVMVLAVPKVSKIVAGKIRRVPSIQEVQAKKDAAITQFGVEEMEKQQEIIRKYLGELSSQEVQEMIYKAQQDTVVDRIKKMGQIQAEYDRKKTGQLRLATNISRLSPASVYTYAATSLAGTGMDRQERFLTAARTYQNGFVQYFNELMRELMEQQWARVQEEEVEEIKFDFDKMPSLGFREASLSEVWTMVWLDVLILFLLVVCFFMLAYASFVRSDIR